MQNSRIVLTPTFCFQCPPSIASLHSKHCIAHLSLRAHGLCCGFVAFTVSEILLELCVMSLVLYLRYIPRDTSGYSIVIA